MLIVISFNSYNKYRFQKPWISKVIEWPPGKSAIVSWGKSQGDEDGGDAEIMATPGDVVRWGQKGASRSQTKSCWGIVQEDGSVEKCTMAQAHKAWIQKQDSKSEDTSASTTPLPELLAQFSTDQLLLELERRGIKP
jgi:hypothetical protein